MQRTKGLHGSTKWENEKERWTIMLGRLCLQGEAWRRTVPACLPPPVSSRVSVPPSVLSSQNRRGGIGMEKGSQ